MGKGTCFQLVEVDTAGESGSIKVNGVIACLFITGFIGSFLTNIIINVIKVSCYLIQFQSLSNKKQVGEVVRKKEILQSLPFFRMT
ncbi:MAG: hypothetical protein P4L35_01190 [Ignavibacteriaceae bacterium]|nr:hypothetical protein [Ignavibacteriaceae bacterium]